MFYAAQVVRYTALLSGVFYGITHRRTLQKDQDEEKKKHAIHEREHLIAQAKEAWKKKQEGPKDSGTSAFTTHHSHPPASIFTPPMLTRCRQ